MNKLLSTVGRSVFNYLIGLCLLGPLWQSAVAATITIGKGSGIVWEGMPYTASNKSPTTTPNFPNPDLIAYSSVAYILPTGSGGAGCLPDTYLTTIAGYKVYKIAPGVGIIPRATVSANYVLNDNTVEMLSGTIGLPATQATTTSGAVITNPLQGTTWCLAPRMSSSTNFYKASTYINATVTGTWVMIADGSQTRKDNISLSNVNFTTAGNGYVAFSPIFSNNMTLRISTLECNVSTNQTIDFGAVARNTKQDAELGSLSYPLTVQCSQDNSVGVDANINVQFRALSSLYEGTKTRLALSEGGAILLVKLIMLQEVVVVVMVLECHLITLL